MLPGEQADPREALFKLIEKMPYHDGEYLWKTEYSNCDSCNQPMAKTEINETSCAVLPHAASVEEMINCPEKPHEKEDCININPETGEKCNAKNVKGTEKWSLCNAKESLIIGVDGSQYGGQPPPVYPSPEIEVEGEYFKLKAVLCYQDLGRIVQISSS